MPRKPALTRALRRFGPVVLPPGAQRGQGRFAFTQPRRYERVELVWLTPVHPRGRFRQPSQSGGEVRQLIVQIGDTLIHVLERPEHERETGVVWREPARGQIGPNFPAHFVACRHAITGKNSDHKRQPEMTSSKSFGGSYKVSPLGGLSETPWGIILNRVYRLDFLASKTSHILIITNQISGKFSLSTP